MGELILSRPVYTLDNQLLLPAGTSLTPEIMDELISRSKNERFQGVPILSYNQTREDLLSALARDPYQVIFSDQQRLEDVLKVMERVYIVLPVLQSLDYFKKHALYTYRHILRVFALSTLLGMTLLEDEFDLDMQAMAGPLHDFGKTCVPIETLKKNNPLTRTERELLEHHALAGYVLLSYYLKDHNSFLARIAKEHHERRNGSGYPEGIHMTDQLVEIIAVSDIYDALISHRPYRKTAFDNRTALEEITAMADQGKLGWDVVKALISFNRQGLSHHEDCVISREKRGSPPEGNLYGLTIEDEVPAFSSPPK